MIYFILYIRYILFIENDERRIMNIQSNFIKVVTDCRQRLSSCITNINIAKERINAYENEIIKLENVTRRLIIAGASNSTIKDLNDVIKCKRNCIDSLRIDIKDKQDDYRNLYNELKVLQQICPHEEKVMVEHNVTQCKLCGKMNYIETN